MKRLQDITLSPTQKEALVELRRRVCSKFAVESVILFGSVARGEADEESDVDLLIVTAKPLDRLVRHQITKIIFQVNLKYGTNFSSLVVDRENWEKGLLSSSPIREEILKEGVPL
jgi:predicted nucleotidyltransferase